jgi:hypothetical protein
MLYESRKHNTPKHSTMKEESIDIRINNRVKQTATRIHISCDQCIDQSFTIGTCVACTTGRQCVTCTRRCGTIEHAITIAHVHHIVDGIALGTVLGEGVVEGFVHGVVQWCTGGDCNVFEVWGARAHTHLPAANAMKHMNMVFMFVV